MIYVKTNAGYDTVKHQQSFNLAQVLKHIKVTLTTNMALQLLSNWNIYVKKDSCKKLTNGNCFKMYKTMFYLQKTIIFNNQYVDVCDNCDCHNTSKK